MGERTLFGFLGEVKIQRNVSGSMEGKKARVKRNGGSGLCALKKERERARTRIKTKAARKKLGIQVGLLKWFPQKYYTLKKIVHPSGI